MAERQRRGPVKKVLKYISQFADPKFNPERRGALQMIAAAPLAPKMKLLQGNLPPGLDPVQFYRGLLTKGLDIADEWTNDPKLLREAFLNELPDSDLHRVWKEQKQGASLGMADIEADAYGQAREDWADRFANDDYSVEGFTPEQVEKLDRARAAFDTMNDKIDAPDFDAADDAYGEAMEDFIDSLDPMQVVQEYGGDDLFSDWYNALRGKQMDDYVYSEAERLGVEPEDLIKRLGVEDFLKKVPKIGNATGYEGTGEQGFIDIADIPEYYYHDPEALRYASLRDMLEHPVLTPQQMLEVTHGNVGQALGALGEKDIARQLYQDLEPTSLFDPWGKKPTMTYTPSELEGVIDLERVPLSVRQALGDYMDEQMTDYYNDRRDLDALKDFRRRLAVRDPEFQRLEDLPSYVGNRTSPLRVKNPRYAGSDPMRAMRVQGPLPYLDVVRALNPEDHVPTPPKGIGMADPEYRDWISKIPGGVGYDE